MIGMLQNHKRSFVLGMLLLGPALGCDLPLFTASETITEVFKAGHAPKLIIETFNGPIDISNGEAGEVVVEVTKHASGFDQHAADSNLDNIDVTFDQKDDEIRIVVRRLSRSRSNSGASVIIAAPSDSHVELKSSNGRIVSEGMQGSLKARTSNGRIEVYEGSGTIDVTSSNGAIQIEADNATVDAQTSNGRIRFSGTLDEADHRLKSSNGRIEVALPAETQFRFDASTSNGSIDCEFPFASDDKKSRRRKSGTVGDDPRRSLVLSTSNSSIRIRKQD